MSRSKGFPSGYIDTRKDRPKGRKRVGKVAEQNTKIKKKLGCKFQFQTFLVSSALMCVTLSLYVYYIYVSHHIHLIPYLPHFYIYTSTTSST